jgi:outer membrane protein TolC
MKIFSCLVCFVLFFCQDFSFAQDAVQNTERTLTESLSSQTALSINPEILSYRQKIEYAQSQLTQARSLYLPQADINLSYLTFKNTAPTMVFNGDGQFITYLPLDDKYGYYSTRISVWQKIYNGGQTKILNKYAKENLDKIKVAANAVEKKVLKDVKLAFNEALYRKELLKLYKIKKQLKNSFENDRSFLTAEFNYKKAILNLARAIGLELNTLIDVPDEFNAKIRNFDFKKCVLQAYQFKLDWQTVQIQEEIDVLTSSLNSNFKVPNISIGASQEWNGDTALINDNGWYIAINATIPIFEGKAGFEKLKQTKIRARENFINASRTKDEIRFNVEKALMEYNFWKSLAMSDISQKNSRLNENELYIVYELNKSYYELEFAVGAELALF